MVLVLLSRLLEANFTKMTNDMVFNENRFQWYRVDTSDVKISEIESFEVAIQLFCSSKKLLCIVLRSIYPFENDTMNTDEYPVYFVTNEISTVRKFRENHFLTQVAKPKEGTAFTTIYRSIDF